MPHFEQIPPLDNIAPEDLLPKTPKRGPKPPVQKDTEPEKPQNRHKLLPKISIKRYKPSIETEMIADNMLREIFE